MKMKIYIAGKVTGENKEDCKGKFAQIQTTLEARGFEAINPLEVVGDWQTPWAIAMRLCLAKLLEADAIVLLPDWWVSKGATIEMKLAMELKMPIFQSDFHDLEQLSNYKWNK